MAKKPALRAVEADEKPVAPLTLLEAVAGGDYLEILLAQRRDIVTDLPNEKGPAKAALHRQLALLSKEIETLQAKDAEDTEGGADVEDEDLDATAV